MSLAIAPRGLSFASMMVRAQRRHEARLASGAAPAPSTEVAALSAATAAATAAEPQAVAPAPREPAIRRTLQKMKGTKRLLDFMYPA